MAAKDITGSVLVLKGVNSEQNYTRSLSVVIDGADEADLLTVATHSLIKIPAGNMISGIKVLPLASATSAGAATLQFLAKVGSGTAEAINGTALALAALAAGKVHNLNLSSVKGYSETDDTVIQMTVGTADFTALKFMIFVEYIPVSNFLNRG